MLGYRKKIRKLMLLASLIFLIVFFTVFSLRWVGENFSKELKKQREAELVRLVELAYNVISPVLEMEEKGLISKGEARERVRNLARSMTYQDEFGQNYIFMSAYDGTMLVQPFEPWLEGTNQWDLQDARGEYVIRKLVDAARESPEGSFVTYYYYPPGRDKSEEKVSYIKGIPSLGVYLGTGMYRQSSFQALEELLKKQKLLMLFGAGKLLLILVFLLQQMLRNNSLLVAEVNRRKKTEQMLVREKELLAITLASIGDGVIAADKSGKVTFINNMAERLTGWKIWEAKGKDLTEIFPLVIEKTGETCENPGLKALRTGEPVSLADDTALLDKAGKRHSIADSAAPIRDEKGRIHGVVLVFRDITEEKAKREKILYLSYHDALTGLYNRRFFEEEMNRLDTKRQLPLALIMGDVNGLKMVNDVFGHKAGDELLIKGARVLKECCRREDIVARWGGDEFVILLPQTGLKEVELICERIKNFAEKEEHSPLPVSIALGYAVKEREEENIWQVLKEAEDWMYRHKLLQSKSFRNSIIASLQATLYERSMETEGHGLRLKELSQKTGSVLGLSSLEQDELALFAVLHDIGKVAIKESILTKPGPLTEEEWQEMKKHPEIGYRIAQATPELNRIAEYILSHHERWDGKGYPRGLKGEEIPLLSRILAVVDAYDAMTTDRLYRKALKKEEAVEELLRQAGIQFDPHIVRIFVEKVLA